MDKRLILVILTVLTLFVAGCSPQEAVSTGGRAFVGGSDGLNIEFVSGLPPGEVFDTDNPFQISVRIENSGEFDIVTPFKVSITGINPTDFGSSQAQLTQTVSEELRGKSIDGSGNILDGDFTTIDFPEIQFQNEVKGAVDFTLRANVCYEYGTSSQAQLCVRKDLRGVTLEEGVCNPTRTISSESSGAPVQISNIRQNVAGSNKIDFFFTIRKSTGVADSLYKSGSSCDPSIANRDIVNVEVSTDSSLGQLTCSGISGGSTTLINGVREIRCSQILSSPDDFETPIQISLTYAYKEFIDTNLQVKHVG